jgi:predicted CoA-substrate-specific enzyme activase
MLNAGIDVGSLTAKCAILDSQRVLGYRVIRVSSDLKRTARRIFDETLDQLSLEEREIDQVVATGYGRKGVEFADKIVTEISCHARGANLLLPEARTVIDIGGQDSKVIALDDKGKVLRFAMNDKCAAGTGRFLEVMADALDVDVSDLGDLSLMAGKEVNISSTCTVFAESEVIGHLANNEPVEEIVAGIHDAIAARIVSLARRVELKERVVLTGGVAKNLGVKRALEQRLKTEILIPQEPQVIGAIGAALFGIGR